MHRSRIDPNLMSGLTLDTAFVVNDDQGLPASLDVDQLRDSLRASDNQAARVNPAGTVAQAVEQRNESQRLDGWTIPLVASVFILTIAQITKRASWRPALTGIAVLLFLVSTSVALVGS